MKLVTEYVAEAMKFEQLAATEKNQEFRAQLEKQAAAYRKLAEDRARTLGLPPPEKPH
jgi:hypothetical protein